LLGLLYYPKYVGTVVRNVIGLLPGNTTLHAKNNNLNGDDQMTMNEFGSGKKNIAHFDGIARRG
jgi:hypothetical protein